jgi:hypothetical protein
VLAGRRRCCCQLVQYCWTQREVIALLPYCLKDEDPYRSTVKATCLQARLQVGGQQAGIESAL